MAAPRRSAPDCYAADESAQLMTSARLCQTVAIGAANTPVTLNNPSRIVNDTAGAGNIAYHLEGDAVGVFVIERFGAGDERMRRADIIGGNVAGTAVARVLVFES